MGRRSYQILEYIIIFLTLPVLALDRNYDMDRLSTCKQEVTIFDDNVVLNGKANAAPSNPPTECMISIKSGYTDGKNRLQIAIEEVEISDCSVFVDIMNGKGGFGTYLKRLGCNSDEKDKLYSETEWITVRFTRSVVLYQTDYLFRLRVSTWEDPDEPGILLGGTRLSPGVIIGIVAGLLLVIILLGILIWCWRSGKIYDYIGWFPGDKDIEKDPKSADDGEYNNGLEKSETNSVKSGIDHRDPAVWNTLTSEKQNSAYRPKDPADPQYLGQRTYQNARTRTLNNRDQNGISLNENGHQGSVGWQRQRATNVGQGAQFRKETLIDDVFESDDNQVEAPQPFQRGHQSRSSARGEGYDPKRSSHGSNRDGESPSRWSHSNSPSRRSRRDASKSPSRREGSHSPSRRKGEHSPTRDSLQRGTEGRDSNRSTSSQKENQTKAKTLAEEASEAKLKSRHGHNSESKQMDPPSDFDSSSVMSIPEPVTVTASLHQHDKNHPKYRNKSHKHSEDLDSNDIEVGEITNENNPDVMVNPHHSKSQKSPKNKKKKKKNEHREREEDILPPEAFDPLFDRPVSEEPYPAGMQPLTPYNLYGMQPGMYPMNYGMPFGMMPAPGTVPPGTQTYAYAYQNMPAPGVPPQQAGQAAFIVQETPTRDGQVQKRAFMMATQESRPENRDPHHPGAPGYSSTPYGEPSHRGSGRQKKPTSSKTIIPHIPKDNGQGHRTAMMKSGVDPRTGIETNQVLWTDTTRDPTDPPPDANPQITRKTVVRTTTRSGYADLPENTDQITDYLQLQADPNEPSFLSPSRSGPHILSSDTPDRDNLTYYLGLHDGHGHCGSPQIVHPAPSRNRAIKDNVSVT